MFQVQFVGIYIQPSTNKRLRVARIFKRKRRISGIEEDSGNIVIYIENVAIRMKSGFGFIFSPVWNIPILTKKTIELHES